MANKCCICGKNFNGYGNNPAPVSYDADARCCDACNWTVVIPARLKEFNKRKETQNDKRK